MTHSNSIVWRSAITSLDDEHIRLRGYDVTDLMRQHSFADVVYLLHHGQLPAPAVQRLMNAMLVAGADHGANAPSALAARSVASGNRRGLEAAIAAGVLAIGDMHGGAGYDCLEMITHGVRLAQQRGLSAEAAAGQLVTESKKSGRRLAGLGHPQPNGDPRTATLFRMAAEARVAGAGVAFMWALEKEAREHIAYLPINVDGAMAAVLYDLGFAPAFAKALFIIAHVAGLSAHVMEEYTREQPMRIHIPVEYDGPKPRSPAR
jgi:citrate synthase